MVDNPNVIGSHLVLDLLGCGRKVGNLEDVLTQLCQTASAKTVAGPRSYQIGEKRYGLVVISTSHLRAVETGDTVSFDLFTCKDEEGGREEANPDAISPRFASARPYWLETFQPAAIVTYEPNHRRRKISSARVVPGENANSYSLEELGEINANHLFLDCGGVDEKLLNDRSALVAFLKRICPGGNLYVEELGFQFEPHGITSVIATPHGSASIHTWPEKNYAAVDVVSFGGKLPVADVMQGVNGSLGSPLDRVLIDYESRVYGQAELAARKDDKVLHIIKPVKELVGTVAK